MLTSSESEYSDEFSESDDESSSDSSAEDISSVRNWCKIDCISSVAPPRFPFKGTPGIVCAISNCEDPLEYFSLFFDDNVLQYIVDQTNLYASQYFRLNKLTPKSRCLKWVETNKGEILLFLSLLILEGINQKPEERMYWSKIPAIETPYFSKIMAEKRFSLIMKFLHFSNNQQYPESETKAKNCLAKIENLSLMLLKNYQKVYILERDVSVDESLLLFKGRLGWKQYIPSKRARFGVKFFVLCESSSGYVSNFIIYTGKNTKYLPQYEKYGVGIKSVLTLLDSLLDKGYCVTVDNFYNSPDLAEILISRKTDIYGTLRTNRRGVPDEIKNKKMKKGELIAYQRGKTLIMKWHDKRSVSILSTIHSTEMQNITKHGKTYKKPVAVLDYNHTMGGVDRMDASISNYGIIRKQKKYYKKIFRHLLDISVWNSFLLYKKNGGNHNNLNFRLKLIERITEENISCELENNSIHSCKISSALRFQGRHFPSYIPQTEKKINPSRRCIICCQTENENGKKIRKETRYYCKICDVALCPAPCFEKYHTKE